MFFQNWDNDPNFNLLDFINDEDHDPNNSLNNQEDPKDKIYKNWQYNHLQFGGNGTAEEFGMFVFKNILTTSKFS